MKGATREDVMAVCERLTVLVNGDKKNDKALAVEAAKLNHAIAEFLNRDRKAADPRGNFGRDLAKARAEETFGNWMTAAEQACGDELYKEGWKRSIGYSSLKILQVPRASVVMEF
jgi:hypothetical protein